MAESGILEVCNFLRSKNILIPSQNQWLKGCIACFRESTANSTTNQLKEFAFEQWKLADLKDIKAPCLPSNCKTAQNLILPGKYAVQINYAVNISESFYKQLQKIRRPAAEDNLSVDTDKEKDKNEPQGNRTLKMEITDGVVTLFGFEDKQIRKLVEPFIPGVKAVLTGPIECRKGVLFLKNENIDLIGGEVDDLLVVNAVVNVLARELKQPENPDPYKTSRNVEADMLQDDDDFIIPDIESIERNQVSNQSRGLSNQDGTVSSTHSRNPTISSSSERNEASNQNSSSNSSTSRTVSTTQNSRHYSTMTTVSCTSQLDESFDIDDDEEFLLMAAQTAQIAERSQPSTNQQASSSSNERKATKSKTEQKRRPSTEEKAHSSQSTLNNYFSSKNVCKVSDNKNSFSDNKAFRKELEESLKAELEILKKDKPKKPEVPKLTFPPKKYPCTMIVNCCVDDIIDKLTLYNNKWVLSAIVRIKGVEMEVDFSPESLDMLIGMSAVELQEKRKEVRENPKLKDKLNMLLKSSQTRILELNCDMKIHFVSYIAKPVILEIYDDS